MGKKMSDREIDRAFREVDKNPPVVLKRTRAKKGAKAAQKQKVAIALSKAQEASKNDG